MTTTTTITGSVGRRRRRRRPAFGLIAAVSAAALLLSACSSDGEDSDGSSSVADAAASSPADATAGSASGGADGSDSAGATGSADATDATGATDPAGGEASEEAPTGTLSYGVTSFFLTHFAPGFSDGSNISDALWTPLTHYDPAEGELEMAMAESVSSDDQKVWTIKIKDGWTFHNGDAISAQSFADSWNANANPKNAYTANAQMAIFEGYTDMNPAEGDPKADTLSGVKVVDDLTLEVTLAKPNAFFPNLIASTAMAPIPAVALEDLEAFDLNPIGNGPFKMAEGGMKTGATEVTLERFADYPGEKAKVASITFKSYQDATAIYTDFQAGAIDIALLDGNDLASARAEFADQVVDVNYPAVVTLGLPTYDPRLDNPKLREALSLAIDRQAIVDALLKGNGSVATGLVPDTLPGGDVKDCTACTFDAAKAKQLLEEAGGFSGELTVYTYSDPTNQAIVDAIANMWRTNLGIEAKPETQEIAQLYDNFAAKSLKGAFVVYAGTNVPHLYGMLNSLFTKGSVLNTSGYDNPEFTEKLDAALAAGSDDAFTENVKEASAIAMADLRSIPLYHPTGGLAHSTRLSGVEPQLLGGANLARISVSE